MNTIELQLWSIIELSDWYSDHDFYRIKNIYDNLDARIFDQLKDFVNQKMEQLDRRFGKPGSYIGDDIWFDVRAEVISRGKNFYDSISVTKLIQMVNSSDYKECFIYCFHKGM